MTKRSLITLIAISFLIVVTPRAEQGTVRQQAQEPYTAGLEQMRTEAFDAAARSFQAAIKIDPTFEMAYYMLGRVQLVQRNYVAATLSLNKARELYIADSSTQSENRQERQRERRDQVAELNDLITALQARPTQNYTTREQIRHNQERIRQIEDADRSADLSPEKAVPAFVSLSLGSAYFRSGKLNEAETAYRAAIAADPRVAEAHVNLAWSTWRPVGWRKRRRP